MLWRHATLIDRWVHRDAERAAKAMADFHAGVIAYATDFDDSGVSMPRCFKCKKETVEAGLAQDDAIVWYCPRCHAEGRISNWQATLWDLSDRPDAAN
jgi:hypothetical protein